MDRLQRTAERAVHTLLASQPTTAAKVAFAWTVAAGPALGRAGRPRWTEDGTLRIETRDTAWQREIRRARPILAARLDALLGPGTVRRFIIE